MENMENSHSIDNNCLQNATANAVSGGTVRGLAETMSRRYPSGGGDETIPHSTTPPIPSEDDNTHQLSRSISGNQTYADGEYLLGNFLQERISKAGLQVPNNGDMTPRTRARVEHSAVMVHAGRDLRMMADAFEKTYERQKVKQKANEIGLNIRSYNEFRELLSSLFYPGGITHSRILVLFFFCSDVAIRTLKTGATLFHRFIQWFFQFLAEHVCDWVERNGGWVAVLRKRYVYQKLVIAGLFIITAGIIYKYLTKK